MIATYTGVRKKTRNIIRNIKILNYLVANLLRQGKASLKIILVIFLCKNKLSRKIILKAEAEFQHESNLSEDHACSNVFLVVKLDLLHFHYIFLSVPVKQFLLNRPSVS